MAKGMSMRRNDIKIIKSLKKRQSTQSVCQLTLSGFGQTGKLLCCETSGSCIANPMTCSSTSKLAQCWNIRGFDPCTRNDPTAKIVCSHQDGIYCLKGKTDLVYGGGGNEQNSINWLLGRKTAQDSLNGAGCTGICTMSQTVCSDSLTSGSCSIQNDVGQTNYFEYQVEICGNGYDYIVSIPTPTAPVSTLTTDPNSPTTEVSGPGPAVANGPGPGPSGSGPTNVGSEFGASGNSNTSSHRLGGGAIAGIVIVLLFVIGAAILAIMLIRKRRQQNVIPGIREYSNNPQVDVNNSSVVNDSNIPRVNQQADENANMSEVNKLYEQKDVSISVNDPNLQYNANPPPPLPPPKD